MTDVLTPQPLNSLVAAAKHITSAKMKRTTPERWQDEAWDLYDEVGELRFVANALANATSRARLFAAKLPVGDDEPHPIDPDPDPDDPEAEPVTENDRMAAETVQILGGGVLGRAELVRRLTVQMFVPGDGYIIGLPPGVLDDAAPRDDAAPIPVGVDAGGRDVKLSELSWHALSVNEVSVRAGKVVLNIGDQTPREVDEDRAMVIRCWRPHPRRWWAADSPVRANLSVLRELVGLTKHVSATIDSRLAGAGLLVLPQSVEVVSSATEDGDDAGSDADPGRDSFVDALVETMTIPIRDRDSAAAVVPLVAKVPDEVAANIDQNNLIRFNTSFDERTKELRDEAIRRLALGLDAPPEVLLGLGSTNHWSAWQIEESTVKVHIEPGLALLCDALTTEYLWPVLEEARVEGARDYVVWFDTTDLTLRPNRAQEAGQVYDRGELSGDALRRESGFDDNDAPPEPEDAPLAAALAMVETTPALLNEPGLPELVRQLREVLGTGNGQSPNGQAPEPEPPEPEAPTEPEGSGMDLPDTEGEPPPVAASGLTVPSGDGRRG